MKLIRFTFKNEAIWMMTFALGPVIVGTLILLAIWLARALL
jgi:hypothetical protein